MCLCISIPCLSRKEKFPYDLHTVYLCAAVYLSLSLESPYKMKISLQHNVIVVLHSRTLLNLVHARHIWWCWGLGACAIGYTHEYHMLAREQIFSAMLLLVYCS